MAKDEIGGVWRTVGGRRIFIKDGEDLASAMKKSGKFKSSKKKISDEELKEKYMNIPEEERVKAYEEGKNWKDLVEEKENYDKNMAEKEKMQKAGTYAYLLEKQRERGSYKDEKSNELQRKANEVVNKMSDPKFKNAPADIQKNVSDFEKAGIKVNDAFETNLYGNGKADRFMLSDGSYVEHTSEAFGKKTDTWSLDRDYDKSGNYNPQSKKFGSYEELINYLKKNK